MKVPGELEMLLMILISRHPTINKTYNLTRFFACSSVLPDQLYATLRTLVTENYIRIRESKNTNHEYEITSKGNDAFAETANMRNVKSFAEKIDDTGKIVQMVALLENK